MLVAVPFAVAGALPGGAKYAGQTIDGGAVQLSLSGNAKRVRRMRIHYTVDCDNGRTGDTYTDIFNPRVRSDHSFRGSGKYKGSGDGSKNTFNVSGKVSARKASGTFSLTATRKLEGASQAVRCKTGKLSWEASRQR